jgi:Mn-dependent DtxR family transcriptional regulator
MKSPTLWKYYLVLGCITTIGSVSVRDIMRHTGLKVWTVKPMLSRLESEGLIEVCRIIEGPSPYYYRTLFRRRGSTTPV